MIVEAPRSERMTQAIDPKQKIWKIHKPSGTLTRHLYRESAFFNRESAGCVCGKVWFSTFVTLFLDLGPFGPITNFAASSNDTNLTRRIDSRHPEPPYSLITPNSPFLFFHFLGFGGRRGPSSHVRGDWLGAPGGIGRGGVHYTLSKETE